MERTALELAAHRWLPTGALQSRRERHDKVLPGVSLLQGHLQQAFSNRFTSTVCMRTEDWLVAKRSREDLAKMRLPTWRLTSEDKATKESKHLAKEQTQQQAIRTHISRKLDGIMPRSRNGVRQAVHSAASSSNAAPLNGVRRSAHQWKRAAQNRLNIQAKSADKLKERAAALAKGSKQAWKDYNREAQEWTPPADPVHPRLKGS